MDKHYHWMSHVSEQEFQSLSKLAHCKKFVCSINIESEEFSSGELDEIKESLRDCILKFLASLKKIQ